MTPKGDHIPKEDRGEGTWWKPPPLNQVQRRGTQVEGAGPTREKAGQPCGPTQAEAQQRQPEAVTPH